MRCVQYKATIECQLVQSGLGYSLLCQVELQKPINPKYSTTLFCHENVICFFKSTSYIQVNFRCITFMNPDQTAPFRAVWSGSIL